jgi:hypothetical protein
MCCDELTYTEKYCLPVLQDFPLVPLLTISLDAMMLTNTGTRIGIAYLQRHGFTPKSLLHQRITV